MPGTGKTSQSTLSGNWTLPLRWLQFGTLLLPAMIALVWAWQSWHEKRENAVRIARHNVELVGEYALRLIQNQELLLIQVDRLLTQNPDIDAARLHEQLSSLDAGFDFTISLGVMDAEGRLIATSRTYGLNGNVSDREFFQALKADDQPLFIDRLILRPDGRDTLVIARRQAGEGFRGTLTAAADVAAFADFLRSVAAEEKAAASLIRSDGKLLVRQEVSHPPYMIREDAQIIRIISHSGTGVYEARSRADGIVRLYAVTQVGDLPLYAVYGTAKETIIWTWLKDMVPILLFLALSALLGFVASTQALRRVDAEQARQKVEFDRRHLENARQLAAFRETMFKELNHRVRNNLQTIQALIRVRSREAPEAHPVLGEIEQRVWAISEVHNLLYNSSQSSHLDLGAFLRTLCNNPSIVPPEQAISLLCDVDNVEVEISQATPAALIVVELVTNAFKHAFPADRQGSVKMTLRRHDGMAEIVVKDDGIGMPEDRKRSSGLRLVQGLVAQIRGRMQVRSTEGTEVAVVFPVAAPKDEGGQPLVVPPPARG